MRLKGQHNSVARPLFLTIQPPLHVSEFLGISLSTEAIAKYISALDYNTDITLVENYTAIDCGFTDNWHKNDWVLLYIMILAY